MSDQKLKGAAKQRRKIICGLCSLSLNIPDISLAATSEIESSNAPPQQNDVLVFAFGDNQGKAITLADLQTDAKQIFAYPQEPKSGVIRNGTRLNQVLLIKLDPDSLSEITTRRAVSGVVAYSGVCSHTGCDVSDWNDEFKRFQCPCHESQFDPSDAAKVVDGPAPWQLAALPLKLTDDVLTVSDEFQGRVGFQQPGLNPFGL